MNRSKIFSLVICLLFSSGSTSSSVEVSRRVHSDLSPDQDVFSNPTCKSSDCISNSTCFASDCCTCQCSYDKPNFLVKNYECKSNVETKQVINADCAFSIRPDNEPLEVLLLTEKDSGKVKFTSSSVRVNCNSDVIVNKWEYLAEDHQWGEGAGNVFFVSHRTVGGQSQDKKDLTFLQWNAKVYAKYGGLLIKVPLHCKDSHPIGCLLAKINGTFTINGTPPPPKPYNSTLVQTSTLQAPTPEPENTPQQPITPYEDPTMPTVPKTINVKTLTPNQQEAPSNKYTVQSSAPYGLYITMLAGFIGLICLGCLVFVAYRKRKTWISWFTKKTSQPAVPVAEETYEDPIYAELPENGQDFDNPIYCDPAGENMNRRNRQDPLPQIPGTESSYQPLSGLTRTNAPEPVTPALPPPNSSPMATDNEAYEYDNPPPIGNPPANGSADYDNPPPIDNPPANGSADYDNPPPIDNPRANGSADYDNPPPIDNPPANKSSGYENPPSIDNRPVNESSADNPPLTTNTDISINEPSDYDNHQQTASPVDYTPPTVDFVPGTSSTNNNQEETGPECVVLEPEETNM